MKSPLLILFIIFNLLAINLVSANHQVDETSSNITSLDLIDDTSPLACADGTACDHCCHITSHLVGFVSQSIQLSITDTKKTFFSLPENFRSHTLEPPFHPPQA
ncbi:MAG: hypothetical protein COB23_07930 [Methylophaga sp.]|nr:MAG: hypothetical protein COB23_07930 [Methylophaga sp.]